MANNVCVDKAEFAGSEGVVVDGFGSEDRARRRRRPNNKSDDEEEEESEERCSADAG